MILYFSGTGNTAYVARSLENLLGERAFALNECNPEELHFEGKYLIFSFPVYSWGVPVPVIRFVKGLGKEFTKAIGSSGIPVLMVCTCGDDVGLTPEMFDSVLKGSGLELSGAWSVIMPNNYVLFPGFGIDSPKVEKMKLDDSHQRIREVAARIGRNNFAFDVTRGRWPRFKSGVINPLFNKYGMNTRKWSVSQECVRCGKCVKVCPVNNIRMVSGLPKWGPDCVSCAACFHYCPTNAISYGKITSGKGQYTCHLNPLKK